MVLTNQTVKYQQYQQAPGVLFTTVIIILSIQGQNRRDYSTADA